MNKLLAFELDITKDTTLDQFNDALTAHQKKLRRIMVFAQGARYFRLSTRRHEVRVWEGDTPDMTKLKAATGLETIDANTLIPGLFDALNKFLPHQDATVAYCVYEEDHYYHCDLRNGKLRLDGEIRQFLSEICFVSGTRLGLE